jgi:uncharacterized coiled-coil protein SlyX
MGRPPLGKQAMSAAERMRRHRARSRNSKPVPKLRKKNVQYAATLYELIEAYAQQQQRAARWLAELQAQLAERDQRITRLERHIFDLAASNDKLRTDVGMLIESLKSDAPSPRRKPRK